MNGRPIRHEFFILLATPQGSVRLEQAIQEFALLVLGARTGENDRQQAEREKSPHVAEAAEQTACL